MKYWNISIIFIVLLFFIYLILGKIGIMEGFESPAGTHYVESNNLVNSSCRSVHNRQYVVDTDTNEIIENNFEMKWLSKPDVGCVSPALYNDCLGKCECPEGLIYDPAGAGCVTADYYYVTPTPPPPPPPAGPTSPPPLSCPPGYIYDYAINACLGKCLLHEYYDAGTGRCIKDCSYSWGDWTVCDPNTGTTTREATIIYGPNKYGKKCPTREISNCLVDCSYSWGNWSSCDTKKGTTYRDPKIVHKEQNGGEGCPTRDIKKCDIDCSYTWSDWTACDPHSGTQSRKLTITQKALNNGEACPSQPVDTKSCGIDCAFNLINGKCNETDGYMYYNVDMVREPQNKDCMYDGFYGKQLVSRNQTVKSKEKCPIECDYDLISPHCNPVTGKMHYVINMVKPSLNKKCYYNGLEVKDNQIVESEEPCAVDCQYRLEKPTCMNGTIHKTVVMIREAINRDCRYNPSDTSVNLSAGVVDSSKNLATYSTPAPGSKSMTLISSGQQKIKDGDVVDTGEFCEMPTQACGQAPAPAAPGAPAAPPAPAAKPVDCVGGWGGWSACKKEYGCMRARNYNITQKAQNGGKACDHNDGDKDTEKSNCVGTDVVCSG